MSLRNYSALLALYFLVPNVSSAFNQVSLQRAPWHFFSNSVMSFDLTDSKLNLNSMYPEAVISVPDQNTTDNKIDYNQSMIFRKEYAVMIDRIERNKVKGFSFVNRGGNTSVIVPEPTPGDGPNRHYSFYFKDRARQDMFMWVTDAADSYVSSFLESAFHFFPRLVLPAIDIDKENTNRLVVTLPTRETFLVDIASKAIVGGVLSEDLPLDMHTDVTKRKFAAISYSGKGLYLRANMRSASPRSAKTATVYLNGKTCQVPGKEVFNQDPNGAMVFKFATDAAFDSYLWTKCKFRIPKL